MSEIKSPYLSVPEYSDDDIYIPELRRRVYFRAAKQASRQSWWDFTINCVFLCLVGGGIYWLHALGFWAWIRGWFR